MYIWLILSGVWRASHIESLSLIVLPHILFESVIMDNCCIFEFLGPLSIVEVAAVFLNVLANAGFVEVMAALRLNPVHLRHFFDQTHADFTSLHFLQTQRTSFLFQLQVCLTVELFLNPELHKFCILETLLRFQKKDYHFHEIKDSIEPPLFGFLFWVLYFERENRKDEAWKQVEYSETNNYNAFVSHVFIISIEQSCYLI